MLREILWKVWRLFALFPALPCASPPCFNASNNSNLFALWLQPQLPSLVHPLCEFRITRPTVFQIEFDGFAKDPNLGCVIIRRTEISQHCLDFWPQVVVCPRHDAVAYHYPFLHINTHIGTKLLMVAPIANCLRYPLRHHSAVLLHVATSFSKPATGPAWRAGPVPVSTEPPYPRNAVSRRSRSLMTRQWPPLASTRTFQSSSRFM